jgi:hypothetical protein
MQWEFCAYLGVAIVTRCISPNPNNLRNRFHQATLNKAMRLTTISFASGGCRRSRGPFGSQL